MCAHACNNVWGSYHQFKWKYVETDFSTLIWSRARLLIIWFPFAWLCIVSQCRCLFAICWGWTCWSKSWTSWLHRKGVDCSKHFTRSDYKSRDHHLELRGREREVKLKKQSNLSGGRSLAATALTYFTKLTMPSYNCLCVVCIQDEIVVTNLQYYNRIFLSVLV